MRRFLLAFCQIEMQSITQRSGQVYRESIYAFTKAQNNYSLRCAVKQANAKVVRGVRKGGVSERVVAHLRLGWVQVWQLVDLGGADCRLGWVQAWQPVDLGGAGRRLGWAQV